MYYPPYRPCTEKKTILLNDLIHPNEKDTFLVQSNTTVNDLLQKLKKKNKNMDIQLFIIPDQLYQGKLNALLLPILRQRQLRQINYKPGVEERVSRFNQCQSLNDKETSSKKQPQNKNKPPIKVNRINKLCNSSQTQNTVKTTQSLSRNRQSSLQIIKNDSIDTIKKENQIEKEEKNLALLLGKTQQQLYNEQREVILCQRKIKGQDEVINQYKNQISNLNDDLTQARSENQKLKEDFQQLEFLVQQEKQQYENSKSQYEQNIKELQKENKSALDQLAQEIKKNQQIQINFQSEGFWENKLKELVDRFLESQEINLKNEVLLSEKQVQEQYLYRLISKYTNLQKQIFNQECQLNLFDLKDNETKQLQDELNYEKFKYKELQEIQMSKQTALNNIINSLQSEIQEKNRKLKEQEDEIFNLKALKTDLKEQQLDQEKNQKKYQLKCSHQYNKKELSQLLKNAMSCQKIAICLYCEKPIDLVICRMLKLVGQTYLDYICKIDLEQIQKTLSTANEFQYLQCSNQSCQFFCLYTQKISSYQGYCPLCSQNSVIIPFQSLGSIDNPVHEQIASFQFQPEQLLETANFNDNQINQLASNDVSEPSQLNNTRLSINCSITQKD